LKPSTEMLNERTENMRDIAKKEETCADERKRFGRENVVSIAR